MGAVGGFTSEAAAAATTGEAVVVTTGEDDVVIIGEAVAVADITGVVDAVV